MALEKIMIGGEQRNLKQAADEIRKTIDQSILLEVKSLSEGANSWIDAHAAIQRGIAQAANNIAQAIEEYGR